MTDGARITWWRDAAVRQQPLAAWVPDPSGHHELRWWDGQAWTVLVADRGVTGVDAPREDRAPAHA